jgi:3-oxoacyl-[acyl-carrier protein] reductase
MSFNGKVAIVTGSSQGIGRGIAERLAAAGCRAVITSRSAERNHEVASELKEKGCEALAVTADLSSLVGVEGLFKQVLAEWGRVDILVNNAGGWGSSDSLDVTEADWDSLMDLNLKAVFFCSQRAAKEMLLRGGVIVNISSIIGPLAVPRRAAYGVAKAGVIALTRVLAAEWAQHDIRVNAVAPGFVVTSEGPDSINPASDYRNEEIIHRTPQRRWGSVGDVAAAVRFLSSDEAGFITGEVLFVDGGWSAYGGW